MREYSYTVVTTIHSRNDWSMDFLSFANPARPVLCWFGGSGGSRMEIREPGHPDREHVLALARKEKKEREELLEKVARSGRRTGARLEVDVVTLVKNDDDPQWHVPDSSRQWAESV